LLKPPWTGTRPEDLSGLMTAPRKAGKDCLVRCMVGKAGILRMTAWEVAVCKRHARQSAESPNNSLRVSVDSVGGHIGLAGS
jgi:hypothetical protein